MGALSKERPCCLLLMKVLSSKLQGASARVASPAQHYCPFDSLALFAALPSSTGVEPVQSLRKDLFPHHLSSHLLHEPLRPVRDRASQLLMQPSSSRGAAMSRACPRRGLRKLLASRALKLGSHGTPPDDVGLDAGARKREGTGLLWGWLWESWRFPLAPRGYVHNIGVLMGNCAVFRAVLRYDRARKFQLVLNPERNFDPTSFSAKIRRSFRVGPTMPQRKRQRGALRMLGRQLGPGCERPARRGASWRGP